MPSKARPPLFWALALILAAPVLYWAGPTLFQSATAKVYSIVGAPVTSAVSLSGQKDRPAGNRRYVINGQPVLGRLSYSKASPAAVLKELAAVESRRDAEAAARGGEDAVAEIRRAMNRPLEVAEKDWGLFAKLNLLPGPDPASTKLPYLVFALRSGAQDLTDVWTFEFPSGSNPLAVFNAPGEEAPRTPGAGIEPYPNSTRAWSMSEFTDIGAAHLEIYAGAGSVEGHRRHFLDALAADGYDLYRDTPTTDGASLLQFSRSGTEVDILISRSKKFGGSTTDVVQTRRRGG